MKHIIAALIIGVCFSGGAVAQDIKLALQAYTFRDRSFAETVETAKRLGIRYIEAYPGQPLGDGFEGSTDYRRITPETLQQLKAYVDEQGVEIVHYGVTDADNDEQWDTLMAFAKVLGVRVIEIECSTDVAKLDRAERAGKKHKIKIGLHNHTQPEGQPEAVLAQLKGRSKMIGAGSDIGHWMRTNTRPLDGVRILKRKFVNMHLTDVEGIANAPLRSVPLGSGAGEIAAVLDELKAQKYNGYVTLEYEHMSPDLETEVGACVRWFNAYQAGTLDKDGKLPVANLGTLWAGFEKTGNRDEWDASGGRKKSALEEKLAEMKRAEIVPESIKGSQPGFPNEGPAQGVGSSEEQKYCQAWGGEAFLSCSLAAAEAISVYTLSSANDSQGRDPKEWILYGSADGENWKEIDHQRDVIFARRHELKAFEVEAPEAFLHYKLQIVAHRGDAAVQFSRFALFAAK